MKTRQAMVYDFMVALSANPEYMVCLFRDGDLITPSKVATCVLLQANAMADAYLETLE